LAGSTMETPDASIGFTGFWLVSAAISLRNLQTVAQLQPH
jgi:hypothetical protein